MKPLSMLFLSAWALIAAGCADPLEQRSSQEVQGQLERGISGQGKLVPHDSIENPTGNASETPPQYPSPP